MRRSTYHRPTIAEMTAAISDSVADKLYGSRGYELYPQSQKHVFEAARLVSRWPERLSRSALLHLTMQRWAHNGGYGDGLVF
jgi:hypothetical protein